MSFHMAILQEPSYVLLSQATSMGEQIFVCQRADIYNIFIGLQ